MKWELDERVDLAGSGIDASVAARQQATAAELCRRLVDQPGVVLADEVGMGKTFVALAVAASAALADRKAPVVVMVPTGVAEKWVKEFAVFTGRCLAPGTPQLRVTATPVRNGSDFLRLLDDPPSERRQVIVLTHGALSARLADPWVELAMVRQALWHQPGVQPFRRAASRWAARILNSKQFSRKLASALLESPTSTWRAVAEKHGIALPDDPVPASVVEALPEVDLSYLRDVLRTLPQKTSPNLDRRLTEVRKALRAETRLLWPEILRNVRVRLPLLILDEAHHVKNDNNLARLFANPEAEADAEELNGALGAMFDRMLFLTATPFQLGHGELLRVLQRFEGVRWRPPLDRKRYAQQLTDLRTALDTTQAAAMRLERAWGRLEPGDEAMVAANATPDTPDRVTSATDAVEQLRDAMLAAEERLRPWVIRHMRPGKDQRRAYFAGAAITGSSAPPGGLALEGDAALPFLLATRAQVLVALHGLREHREARAFFAEGLASSFEAYRYTRRNGLPDADDRTVDGDAALPEELSWYLRHIDATIADGEAAVGGGHPKVEAVVDRAAQLWLTGEKVVIFCFYRETGRALRSSLSARLRRELTALAAGKLGLDPSDEDAVFSELTRIGERIEQEPLRSQIERHVRDRLGVDALATSEQEQAIAVVRRFLRTPSFLARFVELPSMGSTSADLRGPVLDALDRRDRSGSSMAEKITRFGSLLSGMVDEERAEVLDALLRVTTGDITDRSDVDPGEVRSTADPFLPNVRLANGSVPAARRRTLMLGFNTPFFPEVLVASAVMAEGVDLHLECRHVIHHDLDWSPSTLEQRTGRVDRIASKCERVGMPIEIYEPYIAGMYDEKIYRVVKDRDRWFNVVMGEQIDTTEWATDRTADRVPLPAELAASLAFDLAVAGRTIDRDHRADRTPNAGS